MLGFTEAQWIGIGGLLCLVIVVFMIYGVFGVLSDIGKRKGKGK